MRYPLSIALLLLSSTITVSGRMPDPNRAVDIGNVDILGKKTVAERALTRTVIDSASIESVKGLTFAELLAKHSPVFIKTYGLGSAATVSFRGTAASHTNVEWNGITINNPMLGQVDFSMLPVWMVDRVELLHGGSSLQQGSGSLGGSVITGSRPRWDRSIYGSAVTSAGSFGNILGMVDVGGGGSKFQARARYVYQKSENDFEFVNTAVPPFDTQRQKNASYSRQGAVLDLFYRPNERNYLSTNIWWHSARRNLPTIMSYEGPGRDEYQGDDDLRAVINWKHYGDQFQSDLAASYSNSGINYFLANKTSMGMYVNYDTHSRIHSIQAKYRMEWQVSKSLTLRGIADAAHNEVSTLDNKTSEGYSARRTDVGLSVSAHYSFSDAITAFALLRGENNGAFMPSVGVEYRVAKNLSLTLNATRNYHQPTLNDLYWKPGGNPNLRPESGLSVDFGTQYLPVKWLTISATAYASWINDWILWQPSEFQYWTPSNVRNVFARGAELALTATHQFGQWNLSLRGNYSLTYTTNESAEDDSRGAQLIYIPRHKAGLMAEASFRGLYATYGLNFVSERFTTSTNQATRHMLPEYTIHDLSVGYRYRWFEVQIKIDNLLNLDYQSILWRAMPGRNYTLTAKFIL